jgi:hypothetical protein
MLLVKIKVDQLILYPVLIVFELMSIAILAQRAKKFYQSLRLVSFALHYEY